MPNTAHSVAVRRILVLSGALLLCAPTLVAQPATRVWQETSAGSEMEEYLRSLQLLDTAARQPWSLRAFSPVQVDAMDPGASRHPWAHRFAFGRDSAAPAELRVVRPRAQVWYNSTFPVGINDGAVWAGRGATGAVEGGAALRWGPLTAIVAPVAFWSQNASYPIIDNGREGPTQWGDGQWWGGVDYPQRFGDDSYARVDLGQTQLRIDSYGVALGASNAHEWWGPAQKYPFLLGNNAAGFPHLFLGTSRPVNLWIARLHGRVLWGRLEQSGYWEPLSDVMRDSRFATGLAFVVQPRGLEQVELGAARFFHAPWPDEGMPGRYIWRPFEGMLKKSIDTVDDHISTDDRSIDGENQLASAFVRVSFPGSGFEIYGELGKEDHAWDMRSLLVSPDEQSSLTLGFRKAWRRQNDRMLVLRGEAINFQQGSIDRAYWEGRGGAPIYLHGAGSNQGHTQRGQLLGAAVGVSSSAGAFLAVDSFDPSGRWTVEWSRIVRQELVRGDVQYPPEPAMTNASDVVHSLGVERLLFRGPFDLLAGVTGSYNLNRNFEDDRTNLNLRLSVAGLPF
ncbi:MAG TPA: capsule assembly Wzi family protein [Gemmatimonadales bacterium]